MKEAKQEFKRWMESTDLALMITSLEDVVRCVEKINKGYRCDEMLNCRFIIEFADLRLSQMFQVNLLHYLREDCPFIEGNSTRSPEELCFHYPDSVLKKLYQAVKPDGSIRLSWSRNKSASKHEYSEEEQM